jgi:hypothetical protein
LTVRAGVPRPSWRHWRPAVGARAAVLGMFALFLIADLAAGWLAAPGVTGFGFAAGSVITAGSVRRRDLLVVVITPPVIFLTAVICAELITAHGDHAAVSAGSLAAGVFLTISSAAPWMFGGLAGALTIATVRGLRRSVSDLLAGQPGTTRREPERSR